MGGAAATATATAGWRQEEEEGQEMSHLCVIPPPQGRCGRICSLSEADSRVSPAVLHYHTRCSNTAAGTEARIFEARFAAFSSFSTCDCPDPASLGTRHARVRTAAL